MAIPSSFLRAVFLFTFLLVLSACAQLATTSYNGKLGPEASSLSKRQQALIVAARKRAAIKRHRNATRAAKKQGPKTALLKRRAQSAKAKNTQRKTVKKSRKLRRRGKSGTVKHRKVKPNRKSSAFVGGAARRITWNAPSRCLPARLKKVLNQITRKYGRITVNSTHRSRRRNRLVGGKRRSYHLHCKAVDFRVHGRSRGLTRWLARHPLVGGFKRYSSGFYHIDTGPKRSW